MCEMDCNLVSPAQKQYLKQLHLRKLMIRCTQISILAAFFLLWELAARLQWIDPFIFSQPSRMFRSMLEMIRNGSLWMHIGITLYETVVGFLLGTLLGTLAAILLWWNHFISDVSEPYLVVLNSLPKTALAPIIIVWLGNNMTSIIATALMTSVVVTILTVLGGFLAVDQDKIKLIYTFGGTKKQVLSKVILPASIPTIINALKINVGLSFVGVIVGDPVTVRLKNKAPCPLSLSQQSSAILVSVTFFGIRYVFKYPIHNFVNRNCTCKNSYAMIKESKMKGGGASDCNKKAILLPVDAENSMA